MPPPRVHYIDPAALARLIRTHRNTGRGREQLGAALLKIAGGVWDRFRFTHSRDDFVQAVVLHLLQKPLRKADVQKNCFNYMTTCAIRYGLKLRDDEQRDRRRHATYAAELIDSGRPVLYEERREDGPARGSRHGGQGKGVVGRHGADRGPDEEAEANSAEELAHQLITALDQVREELAATRSPRRRAPRRRKAT